MIAKETSGHAQTGYLFFSFQYMGEVMLAMEDTNGMKLHLCPICRQEDCMQAVIERSGVCYASGLWTSPKTQTVPPVSLRLRSALKCWVREATCVCMSSTPDGLCWRCAGDERQGQRLRSLQPESFTRAVTWPSSRVHSGYQWQLMG